jgi:pimeloyl-ACP methyl ester carboxylesterase
MLRPDISNRVTFWAPSATSAIAANTPPTVLLGLSYGGAAVVLVASQSNDVTAVIADGVFRSGAAVFENINRGIAD